MSVVAAVDCGATSVRVCRVDLTAPSPQPEVVHRVAHAPRRDPAGHLRWDWPTITSAVIEGLETCLGMGPLASIGVDTWAVDYGLLDDDGRLVGDPFSYRDHRTDAYLDLVEAFGTTEMFALNGLQLQPFNTVFQLAVHDPEEMRRAARLLWLPELLVHHLCGVAVTEQTSAGCSGLVDVTAGRWSPELLALAEVSPALLGEIVPCGQVVGEWRGVPVSLVAGHDTASAVVGMGARSPGGSAFVSSGTWMLTGIERDLPDTSSWACSRNYSNEPGAAGGVRFLRNVTGFWLLEQCRPAWGGPEIETLISRAGEFRDVPVVDVDDPRLRAPDDMLSEYTALAGLPADADPGLVTRSIIESIATRVVAVTDELATVARFDDVVLFGGAARIDLLRHQLAALAERPVRVGVVEAAALGNAIVQGVAIGHYDSIDAGRAHIADRRTEPMDMP